MSIWGKVIGGAAGFALGGPIGALIGAIGGHVVDKFRTGAAQTDPGAFAADDDHRLGRDQRQVAFTIAVIALGAKLAKVDGVVTRDEIAVFKRVFRIPAGDMGEVGAIFNEAKRTAHGFEPYADQVARLFRRNPAVLEELLDALFLIAKADGVVHEAERDYLRKVARIFGFDRGRFERIEARHQAPETADPYEVLGIAHDASDAAIKARHRKLVLENHPDKLTAQGMPPEFVELAEDKLAVINAAYDRIRGQRGLR
ncbi:MAG: TerB family tellurite resistance protein [Alphaproteobacteria bacterium]|jgi:DnaJ like chaperone protein|nr:TerB family tellurite resistance protein [Alphaproteobacteria bacterium]MDP6517116.1 TerB family tellurite resistance protein [Alphaproteobacteria bacterium]